MTNARRGLHPLDKKHLFQFLSSMELEQVWLLHSAEDGNNTVRSREVPPSTQPK